MHSIYKQGNLPYLSVKMCPKCEQLLPLNVESCPNCRYNFTSKTMSQTQLREKKVETEVKPVEPTYQSNQVATAVEQPVETKPVVEEPTKTEKCVYCDNCGAKIIGSQRYCGGCGAKVSKRICPSCDQIVDANLTFCPLCGERLQEASNVTQVETPVTNQPQTQVVQTPVQPVQQFYGQPSGQPINIYLNPNSVQATVEDQSQTAAVETPQEENKEEPVEETKKDFNGINMGRKRLFLIIQLLLVGVLAAIMVMVPVLTSENVFKAIIPCVTGNSSETLVSGKGVFAYVMECITSKSIDLSSSSNLYSMITKDGQPILTGIPFVYKLLTLISKNPDGLATIVSIVAVLLSYVLIILAMLVSFISGFVGLFAKRPYKGKSLGFLLVSLAIASVLIYTSTFFNPFIGFDSWLLYAFALIFFVWFIVKVVFNKETKLYKQKKEEAKLAKEIEK